MKKNNPKNPQTNILEYKLYFLSKMNIVVSFILWLLYLLFDIFWPFIPWWKWNIWNYAFLWQCIFFLCIVIYYTRQSKWWIWKLWGKIWWTCVTIVSIFLLISSYFAYYRTGWNCYYKGLVAESCSTFFDYMLRDFWGGMQIIFIWLLIMYPVIFILVWLMLEVRNKYKLKN